MIWNLIPLDSDRATDISCHSTNDSVINNVVILGKVYSVLIFNVSDCAAKADNKIIMIQNMIFV